MYPSYTMCVERFKAELIELLRRFTATDCTIMDKNYSADAAPLPVQKVIETVQEVFSLMLDVNLVGSMRGRAGTSKSRVVKTIPDAPDMPKLNVDRNGQIAERNRWLNRFWVEKLKDPSTHKSSIIAEAGSSENLNVDDNVDITTIDGADTRVTESKLMAKSSPEVTTFIRSDTFVRENASKSAENGEIFKEKNRVSSTVNGGSSSDYSGQDLSEILKKLKILKDTATDVVNKIDDIHEGAVRVNIQPIRRLSAEGRLPGLNRTSIIERPVEEEVAMDIHDIRPNVLVNGRWVRPLLAHICNPDLSRASKIGRPIQRPNMMRRSMSAVFPGIPTTSNRPGESKAKDVSVTRKSTSTIPITNIENSKLPSTSRSVNSSSLMLSKRSVTRYDSPANGSQTPNVKTRKKSSLRSPSLPSLSLKSHTGGEQLKNRPYAKVQVAKEAIGTGKRKA